MTRCDRLSREMNRTELIYYVEPDLDRWFPFDRYPRRVLRRVLRGKQMTGFRRRLNCLVRGLKALGVTYRINDFRALEKYPDQSIGLLGKRYILDTWTWRNPMVCGPTMLDHPKDQPNLFERFNTRCYLVAGPWMKKMFEPYFGDRVAIWPIGIDTELWRDFSNIPKKTDFLVYEKFLWKPEANRGHILQPILDELERRKLTWELIRAGGYSEAEYLAKLSRARRMMFLCEHETQGQAYQEALSCNVPVLAWDQGFWLDPKARQYEREPVLTSSVPYFTPECGVRFRTLAEFPDALDEFLSCQYHPREFVVKNLGLAESAQMYLDYLHRAQAAS